MNPDSPTESYQLPMCPRCGAPVTPEATFCPRCGLRLVDRAPAKSGPPTGAIGAAILAIALLVVAALAFVVLSDGGPEPSRPATAAGSPTPSSAPTGSSASPQQPTPSAPPATPTAAPPSATPPPTSPPATPTPPPAFSDVEAELLGRIREDARVGCAPRHQDLPDGAIAAIECVVGSELVDRVGVYGFETPEDAALTYLERVTAEGVTLGSGNCLEGTGGDGAWTPGDGEDFGVAFGGQRWAPDRAGCFLNDAGFANYRATCGGVYIGVLGNTDDLAALSEWANRTTRTETPTPPGICAG